MQSTAGVSELEDEGREGAQGAFAKGSALARFVGAFFPLLAAVLGLSWPARTEEQEREFVAEEVSCTVWVVMVLEERQTKSEGTSTGSPPGKTELLDSSTLLEYEKQDVLEQDAGSNRPLEQASRGPLGPNPSQK